MGLMSTLESIYAFLHRRRVNYRLALMSPAGRQVLADLSEFCCALRTTAVTSDPIDMAIREGRRQCWLRISRAMNLTVDEQLAIMSEKDKPQ
jgi:hypothetical protein